MANEICPVCEWEVHPSYKDEVEGVVLHVTCFQAFMENKDIFKKKYIEFNTREISKELIKRWDFDEKTPEIKDMKTVKLFCNNCNKTTQFTKIFVDSVSQPFSVMDYIFTIVTIGLYIPLYFLFGKTKYYNICCEECNGEIKGLPDVYFG